MLLLNNKYENFMLSSDLSGYLLLFQVHLGRIVIRKNQGHIMKIN
jgi:hypothetical protein